MNRPLVFVSLLSSLGAFTAAYLIQTPETPPSAANNKTVPEEVIHESSTSRLQTPTQRQVLPAVAQPVSAPVTNDPIAQDALARLSSQEIFVKDSPRVLLEQNGGAQNSQALDRSFDQDDAIAIYEDLNRDTDPRPSDISIAFEKSISQ